MTARKQFVTFLLNGLFFGIDVIKVQEVIRDQKMTRVPIAPAMVEGLISLRGEIITVINLRRRLELPERAAGESPMNIVVRTHDGAVSLLVDAIGEVVEIDDNRYERLPESLSNVAREVIQGVYKLEGHLMLILDPEQAVRLPAPFNFAMPRS